MKKRLGTLAVLIVCLLALLFSFMVSPGSASAQTITHARTTVPATTVSPKGCAFFNIQEADGAVANVILWLNSCNGGLHCELIPHEDISYWLGLIVNNHTVEQTSGFRAVGDVMNTDEWTGGYNTAYCQWFS